MKAQRRAYLDQPEVRERMQIAKFKAKNRRKAFMKKIREERRHKTVKKANTLPY
jgi:hypothetical protein